MSRPHSHARKLWAFFSTAALIVALGAAVVFALQTDPQEARALRTRGAVLAVTQGNEPLVLGAHWQKWVLRLFPTLQECIGGAVFRPDKAGPQALVVWESLGYLRGYEGDTPTIEPRLSGDRGEVLETMLSSDDFGWGEKEGDPTVMSYQITNYPRRAEKIRLQFDPNSGVRGGLAEISVLNPALGNYPAWSPGPNHQRSGDLEVTLKCFRTGVKPPRSIIPDFGPETQLDLLVRKNGKPPTHPLCVEGVVVSDSTGNKWEWGAHVPVDSSGRIHLAERPLLLPVTESAYRVRLDLAGIEQYPPEDLWTIRGLRLPHARKMVWLHRRKMLHGCTVELTRLLGAGVEVDGSISSEARVELRVTGPRDHYCFRNVTHPDSVDYWISPTRDGTYRFDLDQTRGERPTTLRLALTPRVSVDFLAHASLPAARAGRKR